MLERLRESSEFIFNNKKILLALRKNNFRFRTAYILGHTPEQGEDIYVVLSNNDEILTIEVDRFSGKVLITFVRKINEYKKKLKRIGRIKLDLAIKLSQT